LSQTRICIILCAN